METTTTKNEGKFFTFKTEKPTGKYRSFNNDTNIIKLNKIEIGDINHEFPFVIRFRILKKDIMEDGNPNSEWKRVQLKGNHKSLAEAKLWIRKYSKDLLKKFDFPND